MQSLRSFIIAQQSSRQASASSTRKSVEKQVYTSPAFILYRPLLSRSTGLAKSFVLTICPVSTPRFASPLWM